MVVLTRPRHVYTLPRTNKQSAHISIPDCTDFGFQRRTHFGAMPTQGADRPFRIICPDTFETLH
jgi:hypothetical protein